MADKVKLRKHGSLVNATSVEPERQFAGGAQNIIEVKEESWASIILGWVKTIVGYFALVVVLLLAVYTGLAATVVFFSSVGGQTALVARGTFIGGIPDKGDMMYISNDTPDPKSPVNNVVVGFKGAPEASIVENMSAEYDKVSVSGNNIQIADQVINDAVLLNAKGDRVTSGTISLNNQYVVQCVTGACDADSYLVIDSKQIYGEIKNVSR
jgi:hypothetical protein